MTPDIQGERLYPRTPATAAAYNERVGADVITFATLKHGLHEGARTRSGERIRIACVRFGRRIFTSMEAIDRWAVAVAESDRAYVESNPVASERPKVNKATRKSSVARAQRDAEAALDRAGI